MLPAFVYADDKQDLNTIRHSIAEQEKKIAEQKKQRSSLQQALQKQEVSIANLLGSLEKTTHSLEVLNQDIEQLNPVITELEITQKKQRKILAKQLEGAFKLGKTGGIELVFGGEESERNERIITYYGYINRERQKQIHQLKATQDELKEKKLSLQQKQHQQLELQESQKKQHASLVTNQKERQHTLTQLNKSMLANQQKLDEMKKNEAALQKQIAEAELKNKKRAEEEEEEEAKQAAQIAAKQKNYNYNPTKDERALMARVSGIGKPQNKLLWPVNGALLHRFGEPSQGELRWKGLVIKAQEGTKVKAIAQGRVILASWLQGYGFIVAIDHGKGDMTLYGYNQRVLVNVGDEIEAGQAIALVGTSGGQQTASLYFEIRRDGKALDPNVWLKK